MYVSNGNVRTDYLKPGCEYIVQRTDYEVFVGQRSRKALPYYGTWPSLVW